MSAAGMDINIGSPKPALNSPIAYALRKTGYTVANHSAVVDSDLSTVTDADLDQIFDFAELRLLKNILGNYAKVDTSAGAFNQSLGQLRSDLETRIARLEDKVNTEYGTYGELEAGYVMQDFADHNDTIIDTV
jgi:hypothetical protein